MCLSGTCPLYYFIAFAVSLTALIPGPAAHMVIYNNLHFWGFCFEWVDRFSGSLRLPASQGCFLMYQIATALLPSAFAAQWWWERGILLPSSLHWHPCWRHWCQPAQKQQVWELRQGCCDGLAHAPTLPADSSAAFLLPTFSSPVESVHCQI